MTKRQTLPPIPVSGQVAPAKPSRRRESVNLPGRVFPTAQPVSEFGDILAPRPLPGPPLPPLMGKSVARFDVKTPPDLGDDKRGRRRSINPIIYTRRGCTDVICGLAFLLFICGWICVAFVAFMFGDPERLLHPTDSKGQRCGINRPNAYNLSSKPYLLYFDLTKCIAYSTVFTGCQTTQVEVNHIIELQLCVETCPSDYFSYLQLQPYAGVSDTAFQNELKKMYCVDDALKNKISSFSQLRTLVVDSHQCTAYTVKSAAVLGRCIPQVLVDVASPADVSKMNGTLNSLISQFGSGDQSIIPTDQKLANATGFVGVMLLAKDVTAKIASDLSKTYWQIIAMLSTAAIVSFLWTVVMRFLGGLMIWISILLIILMLLTGSAICWYKYKVLLDAGNVNDFSFHPNIQLYFEMPTTWLVFAVILSIALLVVMLILLFIRSRIRLAIALITEASKALGSMLSALFFPIFPFVLHLGVFALWASVAIWLASWGRDNCRRTNGDGDATNGAVCDCGTLGDDPTCQFVNVTRDDSQVFGLQAFNLFAFFWASCFVSALAKMTLAGAFASYYWAFNKPDDVPSFPVIRSLGRSLRYHFGSLAFGSLLLAIVKFIRALLDYLEKKLKATENMVVKFILRCLKFLFWILETFLRFLTKNAYIMIAIYGNNFCSSARDSFSLLARNIVRVVVLDKITDFLLFLGKATITIGMGVVSFYYFSGRWMIDGLAHIDLYYYFVPIIIVILGSYFICDAFFDVYEMAVDTTFMCFLEDAESNDGTPEKPYFMSNELLKILSKENNFKLNK